MQSSAALQQETSLVLSYADFRLNSAQAYLP